MSGVSSVTTNHVLFEKRRIGQTEESLLIKKRKRKETNKSPYICTESYFISNSVCPLTISDRPRLNPNSQFPIPPTRVSVSRELHSL
ncbi:hypothetical protein VNO78_08408 [Psophocarpus tetragonolobus]|uniref:Uncharacterized protein n=1 Tax=Psophocarpus tetragonolobus TaxID=3891 RepID=A0AAN9XSL4_PSOTE